MINSKSSATLCALLAVAIAGPVISAEQKYEPIHFDSRIPSKEEWANSLKPPPDSANEALKTRGVATRGVRPKAVVQKPKVVIVTVNFAFNSYELTDRAKQQLNGLGEALEDDLNTITLMIEGHTDSVGSDAYNKKLSEERARAVRRYLVSNFQVNSSNLQTVGYGEELLLDTVNPRSEKNRRVQFKAIQ